jgi:hypothetical protein
MTFSGCSSSTRSERFNHNKAKEESSKIPEDNKDNSVYQKLSDEGIEVVEDPADSSDDEFDEPPLTNENSIDKSKFVTNLNKLKNLNVALTPREKILFEVIKYLDTPYKYGGNSGNGIDCSAFTKQVFENSVSIELPRSAREQYSAGERIDKDELKFGDLVFFNTRRRNNPGHVGIYLGDNQFVHASRKLGVTVDSLDEKYYKARFTGARRFLDNLNHQ